MSCLNIGRIGNERYNNKAYIWKLCELLQENGKCKTRKGVCDSRTAQLKHPVASNNGRTMWSPP